MKRKNTPTHCQTCGDEFKYVFVTTENHEALCMDCFEHLYPRLASKNRLKKSGEQLEFPF